MPDVIATIWDFDKTLIDGYMQDPLFKEYQIDAKDFWRKNNKLIEEYRKAGYEVNADTFYLNLILRYVKAGKFKGLCNDRLMKYGKEQNFYPGAEEILQEIKNLNDDNTYQEYGITFENYIVSTGLKKIIEGSSVASYVNKIWGCEFIDAKTSNGMELSEIAYSIDNTTKTRALFEINKGVGCVSGEYKGSSIDVNTKIPETDRRVKFVNMVYVADGPSDIPAFSVVNEKGGATFAVYPAGDSKAMKQVEKMRSDGRVQMYAEANYKKNSMAYMWIMGRLQSQAETLIEEKNAKIDKYDAGTPKHLV